MCHEDVGAVVGDSHLDGGPADELAEEHAEGAEDGGDTEPADELQTASWQALEHCAEQGDAEGGAAVQDINELRAVRCCA